MGTLSPLGLLRITGKLGMGTQGLSHFCSVLLPWHAQMIFGRWWMTRTNRGTLPNSTQIIIKHGWLPDVVSMTADRSAGGLAHDCQMIPRWLLEQAEELTKFHAWSILSPCALVHHLSILSPSFLNPCIPRPAHVRVIICYNLSSFVIIWHHFQIPVYPYRPMFAPWFVILCHALSSFQKSNFPVSP